MSTDVSTSNDSSIMGEKVRQSDKHDTEEVDVSIVTNTSPETNPTSLSSSPSDVCQPATSNRNVLTNLDDNNFMDNPQAHLNENHDHTNGLPLEGDVKSSDPRNDVPFSPQMSFGGDEYYILSPNEVKLENCDSFTPIAAAMDGHNCAIASPSLETTCPVMPSCFDDVSGFLPPPNISGIDDAFNSALLGCTFFPSPTAMHFQQDSSGSHQLVINLGDIQPHYTPSVSLFPSTTNEPQSNSTEKSNLNDSDVSSNKRSIGKTLDKISQLSNKKSKSKRNSRSLPLRRKRNKGKNADKLEIEDYDTNLSPRNNTTAEIHPKTEENTASVGTRAIEHFIPSFDTATCHPITNVTIAACKCSKSKCLKLYCDCFQAGQICSARCSCKNCHNTIENSGPDGARTSAIENILLRRPDAFDIRVKKVGAGCSCKKNKCLKKYCDCFNAKIKCTDRCRCLDCKNGMESGGDKDNKDQTVELGERDCSEQIDIAHTTEQSMMDSLPPIEEPSYGLIKQDEHETMDDVPFLADDEVGSSSMEMIAFNCKVEEAYDPIMTATSFKEEEEEEEEEEYVPSIADNNFYPYNYNSPGKLAQFEMCKSNMEAV